MEYPVGLLAVTVGIELSVWHERFRQYIRFDSKSAKEEELSDSTLEIWSMWMPHVSDV
jgi:hypothetical protein